MLNDCHFINPATRIIHDLHGLNISWILEHEKARTRVRQVERGPGELSEHLRGTHFPQGDRGMPPEGDSAVFIFGGISIIIDPERSLWIRLSEYLAAICS